MLWITNKNICTLIYIALQTSPNLNNSYIIFFLKTVHCISLRPSEKKSLIKNILQAYFSEERIVDFTIIMSNSTWLEAHSTCLSRNGSMWGEDNTDLFLYIRILAHQKTSWYVLSNIRIIALRNCALCFLFQTSFQCFYIMAYLNILWV